MSESLEPGSSLNHHEVVQDGDDDFAEGAAEEEEEDPLSVECVRLNVQQLSLEEVEDRELEAQQLFQQAVDFEQRGKVYDALPLYRKAVQLVPDIEFKFYEAQTLEAKEDGGKEPKTPGSVPDAGGEDAPHVDLFEKFRKDVAVEYEGKSIQSNSDPGVISTQMHFSDLPPELIFTILRWVVSSQMDMRSLEQCAAVSKGMYLYARDEQLWHRACAKVWGSNVGSINEPFTVPGEANAQSPPMTFTSWRQMFLQRPRVFFNGCYFSKTSYLRMGSNDFQDQFYRPIQLVEYFRYIRFLPDGRVYMLTSPDEPPKGVQRLRDLKQLRPEVLKGTYRLCGNSISIVLKKMAQPQRPVLACNRQRRGNMAEPPEVAKCTKYLIDFRIAPTARHAFGQLVWSHYSIVIVQDKVENSTEFELLLSKYPPLRFGIVRSYDRQAEAPLE